MSVPEPMAVHPQARTRAGVVTEPALELSTGSRRSKSNCGSCGRTLFGDVAYCPYCGHRSASAPTDAGADALPVPDRRAVARAHTGRSAPKRAPQGPDDLFDAGAGDAPADPPGTRRRAAWKPILVVATALAVVAIAVEKLAVMAPTPPAAPATAAVNAPPAPSGGATASTAQAAAAEPVPTRADIEPPPRAPALPPAPNRALCSPASEAAGLCKPQ